MAATLDDESEHSPLPSPPAPLPQGEGRFHSRRATFTLTKIMKNLLRGQLPVELYAWIDADNPLSDCDFQSGSPFGSSLAAPGSVPSPWLVHNYFAEYHLEFFRQRAYNAYPSRLHALFLFATRTDAETFKEKYPAQAFGKRLVRALSQARYTCSYHDASWIEYLRLPHSLSLDTMQVIADAYWSGTCVEDYGLTFMDEPWHEAPVIEALFLGQLQPQENNLPAGQLRLANTLYQENTPCQRLLLLEEQANDPPQHDPA